MYSFYLPDFDYSEDCLTPEQIKDEILKYCGRNCTITDFKPFNCNGYAEATVECDDIETLWYIAYKYHQEEEDALECLAEDNDMSVDELRELLDL